jgi:hypothetical protein
MNTKLFDKVRTYLILILIPLLFVSTFDSAFAKRKKKGKRYKKVRMYKKKRVYNPAKTRQLAITAIVQNSAEVSALAGLKPQLDSNKLAPSEQLFLKDALEGSEFVDDNATGDDIELVEVETTIDEETGEVVGDAGEDIEEANKYDDIKVDEEQFSNLWHQFIDDEPVELEDEINLPLEEKSILTYAGVTKNEFMKTIMDWFGTPYLMGGTSRRAIDCSAFTQTIFTEAAQIGIPRTAREQIHVGKPIPKTRLQFGDLVFFHTYSKRFASHVGIYLGDNLFAHASSRYGVVVSSLNSTYYTRAYCGARRIRGLDFNKEELIKETAEDKTDSEKLN